MQWEGNIRREVNSVVYVLGNGSLWNNSEIKYSLRSLEKYVKPEKVFVITDKLPPWMQNVIHIKETDVPSIENKERNIMRKIVAACEHPEVTEDFLFMNDDHFFTQPAPNPYPYYYQDSIELFAHKRRNKSDAYARTIMNTIFALKGKQTKYFDIHYPILYNKSNFPEIMKKLNWGIPYGYLIKSVYCNHLNIEGTVATDLKLRVDKDSAEHLRNLIKYRDVFSINDTRGANNEPRFFNSLYNQPSKYERVFKGGTPQSFGTLMKERALRMDSLNSERL